MSADAYKSFEVRALEVYDALVACRLERDVALAENQRLRLYAGRVLDSFTTVGFEEDSPQLIALDDLRQVLALAGDAE